MPVASDPKLISVAEAARLAGVTRQTIFNWLAAGKLIEYKRKLDGVKMVDADELAQKLEWRPTPPEGSGDDAS